LKGVHRATWRIDEVARLDELYFGVHRRRTHRPGGGPPRGYLGAYGLSLFRRARAFLDAVADAVRAALAAPAPPASVKELLAYPAKLYARFEGKRACRPTAATGAG
jgi:hypothetical protein